jgi:predicted nucleic acid-binding protein
MNHERVARRLAPLIGAGLVATCPPLDFEALFSARNSQDYEQIRADRQSAYEYLPVQDAHWTRALGVQRSLAQVSRHRSVGLTDLLVAAVAEHHQVTVLHYDSDYDTISEFTDVQTLWVVEPGDIP